MIVRNNDSTANNRLTGTIPSEIGDLTALKYLVFGKCLKYWDPMLWCLREDVSIN